MVFSTDGLDASLPSAINPEFTGAAGTLKIGTIYGRPPMAYLKNEKPSGFDIEVLTRCTSALNYKIEFNTNYNTTNDIVAAVQNGKLDFACGGYSVTEERKLKVDFSTPTYSGGARLVIKRDAKIAGPDDLNGRNVGVLSGMGFEKNLTEALYDPNYSVFYNVADIIGALNSGKIDAFLYTRTSLIPVAKKNKFIKILDTPLDDTVIQNCFIAKKGSAVGQTVILEFNGVLAEMKSDGRYDKIMNKWVNGEDEERVLPIYDFSKGTKGTLVAAVCSTIEPAYFMKNGIISGFEIELFYEFCLQKGYVPSLIDGEFTHVTADLETGKAIVAFSDIVASEERKVRFAFGDPSSQTDITIGVYQAVESDFLNEIGTSFHRTLIEENRYLLILQGPGVTIIITLLSALIGTGIGYGICVLRLRKSKWARMPMRALRNILQGIPIIVLLYFLYFVVFAKSSILPIFIAVIGFGIAFSVEVAEILRTGVESIDPCQEEAALAMGFSRAAAFQSIVMPQVIKRFIPVYRGSLISMVKSTSLASLIAVLELNRASDIIRSTAYEVFMPLAVISILYFALSWGIILLLRLLDRKLRERERTRKIKGVDYRAEKAPNAKS